MDKKIQKRVITTTVYSNDFDNNIGNSNTNKL